MCMPGQLEASSMFDLAFHQNMRDTWLLRMFGLGIMWLGLVMFLSPLSSITQDVPILGTLASLGIAAGGCISAFVFTALTIAVAWLWYRPLVSIALMLAAFTAVMVGDGVKNNKYRVRYGKGFP